MRASLWCGVAALAMSATALAGCVGGGASPDGRSNAHRSLWRMNRSVPGEQARRDLLALAHALDEYWLVVAEANPSVRTRNQHARTPDWSCDACNALRGGTFDQPSGFPAATCHRCGTTSAERVFNDSRTDMLGRYPTVNEGLDIVVPFLRGAPLGEDLADPWGSRYVYMSAASSAYGLQGVPRGRYLLYSTGPNRIDEGGAGDDLSNLPELFISSRETRERAASDEEPRRGPDHSRGFPSRGILSWGLDFGLGFGFGG